jgi:hypothetical protein
MKNSRQLLAATGVIAALSLAGCWDDSNNDPVPQAASTEVPDSAALSTASFVSYILSLSGSDESSEPLTIKDTLAVPADDSAEPTPLT